MSNPDDVLKTSKHHSLRDRIAAVITGIRIQRDGDSYKMADAVIAALGLTESDGVIVGCNHE